MQRHLCEMMNKLRVGRKYFAVLRGTAFLFCKKKFRISCTYSIDSSSGGIRLVTFEVVT